MVREPSDLPDHSEEDVQPPQSEDMARPPAPRGPFTLASLLDLNEADLAVPLQELASPAHGWEHLTLGVTPETGEAVSAWLRTGGSLERSAGARGLIPGLDAPGAIEIPVYLAGRALRDHLAATPPASDVVAGDALALRPVWPQADRRQPAPALAPSLETPNVRARWTKRFSVNSLLVPRLQCADCPALFVGERCDACGGTSAVRRKRRLWRDFATLCITSEHRAVRTLAALMFAPGELTASCIAGQTRRFAGPALVSVLALIVFAAISLAGSVRPRPDRALMIGTGRTAEVAAGLVNRAPVDAAAVGSWALIHDIAAAVNFVPVLFLPLMGALIFGATVVVRVGAGRGRDAALPFTAHVVSWFILWWGLAVPGLLLLLRAGFESAAVWAGVEQVRYLADGRLEGLSGRWNDARALVITGNFHSALLALGLLPWVVLAWRRAFDATWMQAVVAGALITAIPLLLLVPFA